MAESPVLLEALVKDISLVAKLCPQHIARHFKVSLGTMMCSIPYPDCICGYIILAM